MTAQEIAWRGFFLGKCMRRCPYGICAVFSSVLFAMGHMADAGILLLLYGLSFVFIDGMMFWVIFKKTGNCLLGTVLHIIRNAAGLLVCFFML